MNRADVNTCPERARKRASSDLRCAAKKLGCKDAVEVLLSCYSQKQIEKALQSLAKGGAK